MNATEKKYVEKLKEYIHHLRINGSYDYKWNVFEFEISALEQQISEEVSYPREFVEYLKNECYIDFDYDIGQDFWVIVKPDGNHLNTEEAFEYWQSKVKPK